MHHAAALCATSRVHEYRRREPEHTALYAVLQRELETFLARTAPEERLPAFIERELRAFLRCLHASVSVPASARDRLEQLLRYCARPAISHDRLELLGDGRAQLELKTPRFDGTTHLVLTAHELVERLVAVIPRPQKNRSSSPECSRRARGCAPASVPMDVRAPALRARLAHARAQHPILPQRPTLPTRQAGARGRA